MEGAVLLWQEFLEFCEDERPDDLLAVDFVRLRRERDRQKLLSAYRASRDLETLQALIHWHERTAPRQETCSQVVEEFLRHVGGGR